MTTQIAGAKPLSEIAFLMIPVAGVRAPTVKRCAWRLGAGVFPDTAALAALPFPLGWGFAKHLFPFSHFGGVLPLRCATTLPG